VRAVLLK